MGVKRIWTKNARQHTAKASNLGRGWNFTWGKEKALAHNTSPSYCEVDWAFVVAIHPGSPLPCFRVF